MSRRGSFLMPVQCRLVVGTLIGDSLKFNIRAHCALLASQVLELELSRDKYVFIEDVVW